MRFADDMVVCGNSRNDCERFVFEASSRLHEIGLDVNVAKVKYCDKREFQRFWGFVIMDRFESGDAVEALSLLRQFVDDDTFGRKVTALKRAITIVDRRPELGLWRRWVHDTAAAANLPLQLSREQLLAFLRISGSVPAALDRIVQSFTQQPFTQPKAILLRVLESLNGHTCAEVRNVCQRGITDISNLDDPVLNIALRHLSN